MMNATELADFYEPQSYAVAEMLRKQAEAINMLREALKNTLEHCDLHQGTSCAEQALKYTEEFK